MRNVLITGGAGFIGSHLTIKLVDEGYNVTILDNLSEQIHGKERERSVLYKSIKDISRFLLGDVCNKSDWKKALEGQDVVIHLAAETGTGQSMYEVSRYNKVNVLGSSYLFEVLANQDNSVKKIILASSRAVYGEGKYYCPNHATIFPTERDEKHLEKGVFDPICDICHGNLTLEATDEASKIHPVSVYGITKQIQEQIFFLMGKNLDIPIVALRYQNVYGPRQSLINPYTGILSVFSTRLLNNNDIDIFEDGMASRDFVFIDDVVNSTILALKKEANNQVFNVGSGVATTINEVANQLKLAYNSDRNLFVSGRYRKGDIRHNLADLSKISSLLGYVPEVDFKTGMKKFTDWVQTQNVSQDQYKDSITELTKRNLLK